MWFVVSFLHSSALAFIELLLQAANLNLPHPYKDIYLYTIIYIYKCILYIIPYILPDKLSFFYIKSHHLFRWIADYIICRTQRVVAGGEL